jgi:hypothetical protein
MPDGFSLLCVCRLLSVTASLLQHLGDVPVAQTIAELQAEAGTWEADALVPDEDSLSAAVLETGGAYMPPTEEELRRLLC